MGERPLYLVGVISRVAKATRLLQPADYETSADCSTLFHCVQLVPYCREFSSVSPFDRPLVFRYVCPVCWQFCWRIEQHPDQAEELARRLKLA
jgi:hypothetical protein